MNDLIACIMCAWNYFLYIEKKKNIGILQQKNILIIIAIYD